MMQKLQKLKTLLASLKKWLWYKIYWVNTIPNTSDLVKNDYNAN